MATTNDIISKAFWMFDEETPSKYEQNGNRITALEMLNDGYAEVCRKTKCCRRTGTLVTVPGVREYDQPEGCVGIFAVECPAEQRFLSPIFYDSNNIYVGQPGPIYGYYLTADKIGFDAIPNQVYTLNLIYFTGPTEDLGLDDEPILIPSLWRNRILHLYVLWKLFAIDKREEISARAPYWRGVYESKLEEMREFYTGEAQYAGELPELE